MKVRYFAIVFLLCLCVLITSSRAQSPVKKLREFPTEEVNTVYVVVGGDLIELGDEVDSSRTVQ